MSGKRTNFKTMNQMNFIAYLDSKSIPHNKIKTTTILGVSVVKIKPDHFRLGTRVFELSTGKQIDSNTELTVINIKPISNNKLTKKQLIKIIDERIQNMGTKGVYHPKRLKPKWNSLTDDKSKLQLFEKYITNKDSSIGFLKLIKVNLCHKTLEAIVIEYPSASDYLTSRDSRLICIDKFSRYSNGKKYLNEKGIAPGG